MESWVRAQNGGDIITVQAACNNLCQLAGINSCDLGHPGVTPRTGTTRKNYDTKLTKVHNFLFIFFKNIIQVLHIRVYVYGTMWTFDPLTSRKFVDL